MRKIRRIEVYFKDADKPNSYVTETKDSVLHVLAYLINALKKQRKL